MAEIVILKPGEAAPDSGDRILVVRDAIMKACGVTVWLDGAILYCSPSLAFDGALIVAQKNAVAFNVETIYLQEIGGARRS
jgi:hypothetical protein